MTYLTWRRELVSSAIDQMLAATDPDRGPFGDGGVQFNALMQKLSRSLPALEIVAAAGDILTAHRGYCEGRGCEVAQALRTCLAIPAEKHGLERRLTLDRQLVEHNAFCRDANLLLVWDGQRGGAIEELSAARLSQRFPCQGTEARWNTHEFVALMQARALQCRRTRVALEILAEDPSTTPSAGTVVLVFPADTGPRPWAATVAVALRTDALPESAPPSLDGNQAMRVLSR
ncbi:hypothetical protein [Synechococcus sp. CCY 9618]|uniref:hypothetical protein n=1 Tax=Synechococcus sp. CCY 9618 TaxID=2815602 RepID=UPI001C24440C|nr:hypothetical protein [Synechococcus sp. CCY 9618]